MQTNSFLESWEINIIYSSQWMILYSLLVYHKWEPKIHNHQTPESLLYKVKRWSSWHVIEFGKNITFKFTDAMLNFAMQTLLLRLCQFKSGAAVWPVSWECILKLCQEVSSSRFPMLNLHQKHITQKFNILEWRYIMTARSILLPTKTQGEQSMSIQSNQQQKTTAGIELQRLTRKWSKNEKDMQIIKKTPEIQESSRSLSQMPEKDYSRDQNKI